MRNSIFTKVMLSIGAIVLVAIIAMMVSHAGFALIDRDRQSAAEKADQILAAAHGMRVSAESSGLNLLQFLNSGERPFEEQARRHDSDFKAHAARLQELAPRPELINHVRELMTRQAAMEKLGAELIVIRTQQPPRTDATFAALRRLKHLLATQLHGHVKGNDAAAQRKLAAIHEMEATVASASGEIGRYLYDTRNPTPAGKALAAFAPSLETFKTLPLDATERRWVGNLESLQAESATLIAHTVAGAAGLRDGLERTLALQYEIVSQLDQRVLAAAAGQAADLRRASGANELKMFAALALMSILLLLLALWAGRYSYQSMVQPMRQLARGANAVAEGRLDHRIHVAGGSGNEIAEVARNFNHMVERLQATTVTKSIHEQKERELRTLLDSVRDYAIFVTNTDGCITSWNIASTRIFGYDAEEIKGVSFAQILRDRAQVRQVRDETLQAIATSGRYETDTRLRRKDGSEFDANFVVTPLAGQVAESTGFTVVVRDITQRRNAERHIEQLATRDALTGLPNRGALMEKMNVAIAHAVRARHQMALMFVDLDHFKSINDTLGHVAGDALLSTVAKRLTDCVREVDVVARWGGDEFVVLLTDVANTASVRPVAQRMLEQITAPLKLLGHHAQTSASIGVCLFPDDGQDAHTLLKHADIAMYHAKEAQRNNFQFFAPVMNDRVLQRLQLERDLAEGLQKHQFILHFQPQVSVQNGRLIGVEALVRWQHPEQGLLSPAAFIALAEDTGLIKPIGEWVLNDACRAIKRWHDDGFDIPYVVVNVSAAQLNAELPALVRRALLEHQIEPGWLMLEITETLLMEHVEQVIDTLTRIRELGIRIAMDDFGTGYSSLGVLQRLPLNALKIDRSFIAAILDDGANNERAVAIIGAIVAIAKELDLSVVAEGVETSTQLAFLRTLDCEAYQGYLYSKPLAEADLLALAQAPKKSVLEDANGRAITMSTRVTLDLLAND